MAPFSRLDLDPNPRTRLGPEYFRNLLAPIRTPLTRDAQRGLGPHLQALVANRLLAVLADPVVTAVEGRQRSLTLLDPHFDGPARRLRHGLALHRVYAGQPANGRLVEFDGSRGVGSGAQLPAQLIHQLGEFGALLVDLVSGQWGGHADSVGVRGWR
jgi:hypothetical protein